MKLAWIWFRDGVMQIVNKHAPLKSYRVKEEKKKKKVLPRIGIYNSSMKFGIFKAMKSGLTNKWFVLDN